jgi:uncharacterized membrane protein (DUF106 family)
MAFFKSLYEWVRKNPVLVVFIAIIAIITGLVFEIIIAGIIGVIGIPLVIKRSKKIKSRKKSELEKKISEDIEREKEKKEKEKIIIEVSVPKKRQGPKKGKKYSRLY